MPLKPPGLEPIARFAMDPGAHLPQAVAIESYGNGGFRFGGMSHRGALLALPSGMYGWSFAGGAGDLDPADLDMALALAGSGFFLLLGTGRGQVWPPSRVIKAFVEAGIALEVMDTGAAVRTYNVLLAEGRPVGAALIAVADTARPPKR